MKFIISCKKNLYIRMHIPDLHLSEDLNPTQAFNKTRKLKIIFFYIDQAKIQQNDSKIDLKIQSNIEVIIQTV